MRSEVEWRGRWLGPDHAPRGPIQVETQEPPYGKNAVFTGILATTEAPA